MNTLTAPHSTRHGVRERAELFLRALPLYERKLRRYVKELDPGNADLLHWSRSTEWEPCKSEHCTGSGPCLAGHPHAHCVMFSPYLDQAMLAGWWLACLEKVGYFAHETKGHSNVDIREAKGPGAVAETIKYIFKDIDGKGSPIDDRTFAAAYTALEGRRLTQCSRGLMKLADVKKICPCGASGCFSVKMVDGVRADLREKPGIRKVRPAGAEPREVVGV